MNTVLAAFQHRHAAQYAIERLAQAGYAREDLHVEHELEPLRALGAGLPPRPGGEGMLGALGRVFADLVTANVDAHQQDLIRAAVERGAAVLVLRCGEPARAAQAGKLLRQLGAFNVAVASSVAAH